MDYSSRIRAFARDNIRVRPAVEFVSRRSCVWETIGFVVLVAAIVVVFLLANGKSY